MEIHLSSSSDCFFLTWTIPQANSDLRHCFLLISSVWAAPKRTTLVILLIPTTSSNFLVWVIWSYLNPSALRKPLAAGISSPSGWPSIHGNSFICAMLRVETQAVPSAFLLWAPPHLLDHIHAPAASCSSRSAAQEPSCKIQLLLPDLLL